MLQAFGNLHLFKECMGFWIKGEKFKGGLSLESEILSCTFQSISYQNIYIYKYIYIYIQLCNFTGAKLVTGVKLNSCLQGM